MRTSVGFAAVMPLLGRYKADRVAVHRIESCGLEVPNQGFGVGFVPHALQLKAKDLAEGNVAAGPS